MAMRYRGDDDLRLVLEDRALELGLLPVPGACAGTDDATCVGHLGFGAGGGSSCGLGCGLGEFGSDTHGAGRGQGYLADVYGCGAGNGERGFGFGFGSSVGGDGAVWP